MKRTLTISLDVDWFYRWLLPWGVKRLIQVFAPVDRALRGTFLEIVNRIVTDVFQLAGPRGVLARSVSAGNMVFIAIALLAGYLVIYLI